MRVMRILGIGALLGLGLMIAWAFGQQASATRQVAQAASMASGSAAVSSVAVIVMAGLALALMGVVAAAVVYIWLLRRRVRAMSEGSEPRRGPNGTGSDPTRTINAMVQMEMLRMMRDLRDPQPTVQALPGTAVDDDVDAITRWW